MKIIKHSKTEVLWGDFREKDGVEIRKVGAE